MFYSQLIKLCKERNIKPTPLVKSLGLSPGNLKRWENGASVNSDILSKFAEYFDVSIDFLLGRIEDNFDNNPLQLTINQYISEIIKANKITQKELAIKIGVSTSTLNNWLKLGRSIPSEYIAPICESLGVQFETLLCNASIEPNANTLLGVKNVISSTRQRVDSLNKGTTVSSDTLFQISNYVNHSITYLLGIEDISNASVELPHINSSDILEKIFEILDCCAETDSYKILQIRISYIIINNLSKKGVDKDDLNRIGISSLKIDFLYDKKEGLDKTFCYGFTFSELMKICREFNVNCEYLLTGNEKSNSPVGN